MTAPGTVRAATDLPMAKPRPAGQLTGYLESSSEYRADDEYERLVAHDQKLLELVRRRRAAAGAH